MDIKIEVGKRIRMLREMKHITRVTLCDDETEITVRQLARIESGQSSPSLSKVEYIAYKLGCPISHIVDMDHMILPSEYLILKDKLIKFQTYGDDDRIQVKEEFLKEFTNTIMTVYLRMSRLQLVPYKLVLMSL